MAMGVAADPQDPNSQSLRRVRVRVRVRVPLVRRRKVQTVRLGGKRPRRPLLARLVRLFMLRRLKLYYLRMLRRLKEYYRKMVRDMVDGSAAMDAFQQRLLIESSFAAIPIGLAFSAHPSHLGSDCPARTIF